ncbi:putative beta-N-acetylglucosaminidase [Symbiobacterium thermophilum IAM 14863]|uniref:Putative beta-N-acetylglucosaminidase n=2 Tax=Symbiobacterium thermophilum TaxID=2734 RepID=Q67SQ8_SYMTH|nr:putative beta-N-acetylglucosaminidase [Symbiobacterium thermophilum IAM 14863]
MRGVTAMSLAERAGELFMIGFRGTDPGDVPEALIRTEGVGGVILFARNLVSADQARRLTARIQSCSPDLPLLIAVDQEGGIVLRLAVTPWPGAMSLGAAGSPDLTRRVGAGIARELRAMGINMNLAPVLDVNVNPANPVIGVRSFGSDPARVAEHGAAYIRGHHDEGVLATAKHFPGHGDTDVDSHLALARVPHGMDRLEAVELVPFRWAIAAGVDAIMTAHVVFPAVEPDPDRPATLSPAVLTGLLREQLGFDGLVITDCMEMKAIADHAGTAEGAVQAIAAGADLVLISHTERLQREAIAAVRAAIASGRIPAWRVEEALRRVRAARERVAQRWQTADLADVGAPAHQALAAEAAAAAVTAVGDLGSLVPLRPERALLLAVDPAPVVEVEEREPAGSPVLQAAARLAPALRAVGVRRDPDPDEVERLVAAAAGADPVVVATFLAPRFPGQVALVRALQAAGHRVVLVPQRGPYDLLAVPGMAGAVVMYEERPLAAEAALRCLLGQAAAPGRLPVALPGHSD